MRKEPPDTLNKKPALLMKDYEVLTQQVDERMRQAWTLGSIFVSASLVIFAQAIVNRNSLSLVSRFLLMVASLLCYLIWLLLYLRNRKYNRPSYARIDEIERKLGLYAHRYLNKTYERSRFLKNPQYAFVAFGVFLSLLWILIWILPENLFLPSP